jgi:hypothetical protein
MEWNTPRILKAGGALVTLTAVLLMLAAVAGARSHRHEIQAIGRDSAPSIVAAQHIGAALADMDATAADEDRGNFEKRRAEAVSAIVTAAENITFGDAERVPIRKLALGIGTYAAAVQNARDKRQIDAWRQAEDLMDTELLPAAAALDKANRDALEQTWARQKSDSARVLAMTLMAGILLGGALVALQVFLAARMRRTLNPGLFAATVAAGIFVVFAGQAFQNADRDLRVAKEDAFDSILALWQARSLAYSANGDLSRAVLDPAKAESHRKDFSAKDEKIRGYIETELSNITFAGEREAAEEMRAKFVEFIREQKPGTAAFTEFDAALGKTLNVNQDEFDRSVERGFRDVADFEIVAPLATLAICALAWLGLRPRLREYSA